jgi:membrane-associated protease RseP (regulator of RpoE activity)
VLAYIIGVVLFALGIGLAVGLHEAGHMFTAKAFGMHVRRFYLGFGPRIFSFRKGPTEYGLKAFPLGGFCDIAGMTALDEVTPEEAPRAMWRYPTWKRVVVLVSGSLTHFVLGFVVLYLMAITMGLPNLSDSPVITSVAPCAQNVADPKALTYQPCGPGSPAPAKQAGLQPGDEIVAINGKATPTWTDVTGTVQKLHGKVPFTIARNGQDITVPIDVATVTTVPDSEVGKPNPKTAQLGAIGVVHANYVTYNGLSAFGGATNFTGQMFAGVGLGIKELPSRIPNLIKAIGGAPRSADTPMSVVGASRLGGQAVENDAWSIFWLLFATLQFFLGVFNLLPLLPLDGGHIAVALYEKVRNWLRHLRGRPSGGPVDYTKLAPLTLVVVFVGGAMVLLTVTADIVNPIRIGGQ